MRIERRLKIDTSINLTPLIDVILQLIIFFMITTTFKTVPGISLRLPSSSTAQSVQSSVMRIVVASETEIYVDRQRTDLEGLGALVAGELQDGDVESTQAVIEGDKAVPYQLLVSVLDVLRKNGVQGVGLRTFTEKGSE